MRTKVILGVFLVGLLAAGYGLVAQTGTTALKAQIGFDFTAGTKALPAGMYTFSVMNSEQEVRVQGEGNNAAIAFVVTRLAADIHTTPQDSHIVFDTVGDKSMLSELWIPGQDGYVLLVTKGKHGHKVINVQS